MKKTKDIIRCDGHNIDICHIPLYHTEIYGQETLL